MIRTVALQETGFMPFLIPTTIELSVHCDQFFRAVTAEPLEDVLVAVDGPRETFRRYLFSYMNSAVD
jgi:hypothetical protein